MALAPFKSPSLVGFFFFPYEGLRQACGVRIIDISFGINPGPL